MKSNLVAEIIGSKVKGSNQRDIIFTPENISVEMIEMMDESAFTPDATFIDLYCKSGNILKAIYKRLMTSKYMKEGELADERKRREYILKHQLFGVCADKFCWMISIRNVYGQLVENSNIKYIKGFDSMVNNDDQALLWKTLREEFNMEFQFDHVVMNPPYNNGMDLDFVDFGYKVAKKDVVAITPAKWQTAEATQSTHSKNIETYGEFRDKYAQHMKKICFYPDCYDVFAISLSDGITYYMIDKQNVIDKCHVVNKCVTIDWINSSVNRDIKHGQSLHNVGNEIVQYIKKEYNKSQHNEDIQCTRDYNKLRLNKNGTGKYAVNINKQVNIGGGGYSTREIGADGHWHVRKDIVGNGSMLFSKSGKNLTIIGNPNIIESSIKTANSKINIFTSDDIDKCKSFYSYMECKLVRFLLFINISIQASIGNEYTWKFVPAPPSEQKGHPEDNWNHIYTDEELYEYFGLNKEDAKTTDGVRYKDIIEAVIKERE